ERRIALAEVSNFESITGKGVTGVVDGRRVAVGNTALLEAVGVSASALNEAAQTARGRGETVMFAAIDGRAGGLIGVADRIKPTTKQAVESLQAQGLKVVMLTGDNRVTAEAVARSVGISDIEADVLPERKAAVVSELQAQGRR